jgi:Na+/proline symporter
MNIIIGVLVIIYTFSGGTKAVNVTQKQCLSSCRACLLPLILHYLPNDMTFYFLLIAGANDKMNIVNFSFDPEEKYTFGAE